MKVHLKSETTPDNGGWRGPQAVTEPDPWFKARPALLTRAVLLALLQHQPLDLGLTLQATARARVVGTRGPTDSHELCGKSR